LAKAKVIVGEINSYDIATIATDMTENGIILLFLVT
jgi:hypothetical protein